MQVDELVETLTEVAKQCAAKGPGYAQQSVVLREIQQRRPPQSVQEEQQILETWHALFAQGKLAWGYNLDNPGPPFFHVPNGE